MRLNENQCKEIFYDFYNDFEYSKDYKTIEFLFKENKDKSIIIFHIGQWNNEKENNTFDYDMLIINTDNEVIYDESNGELKKEKIYEYFNNVNDMKQY